jgi:hypothetical protein
MNLDCTRRCGVVGSAFLVYIAATAMTASPSRGEQDGARRPRGWNDAVVFVVDRAASMADMIADDSAVSRQTLVNHTVTSAIEGFQSTVWAGAVVTNDEGATVPYALQYRGAKRHTVYEMLGVTANGDKNLSAGLEAALEMIQGVPVERRGDARVIAIIDGAMGPVDQTLTERFADADISVTPIVLTRTERPIHAKALAKATGGTFFAVSNISLLPEIVRRDTFALSMASDK